MAFMVLQSILYIKQPQETTLFMEYEMNRFLSEH